MSEHTESIVMEGDKTGIPPNTHTTQEHLSKEIFAITNLRIFFYSINIKDVMGFEASWILNLDQLKLNDKKSVLQLQCSSSY